MGLLVVCLVGGGLVVEDSVVVAWLVAVFAEAAVGSSRWV